MDTETLFPDFKKESTNLACFKDLSSYLDKLRSIKDYFFKIAEDDRLDDNLKCRIWNEEVNKYKDTWKVNVNPDAMKIFLKL